MNATPRLHPPTRLLRGRPFDAQVGALVDRRRWALLTSRGWVARGATERLQQRVGATLLAVAEVNPNPTLEQVTALSRSLPDVHVIVALGGGSVIDAAKAVAALRGIGGEDAAMRVHLRDGVPLRADAALAPVIAVPTTAGTGSEVTCWGTIWDGDTKRSVVDSRLHPSHAIFDPGLLTSMPAELALVAGLDAISHAMESVWNRRHTPRTDRLATLALILLRKYLGASLEHPQRVAVRGKVQLAALLSGLAMSTTQTALAHSISYPLTARFGVPHGLACSFTLAEVARYNAEEQPERMAPIAQALRCAPRYVPQAIEAWFATLGVDRAVQRYLGSDSAEGLGDAFVHSARAANNLRAVDADAALGIARAALQRFAAWSLPSSDRPLSR